VPENVALPPLFLERMSQLLADDYPSFLAALQATPVSGLRVNTLKLTSQEFIQCSPFPLGERVPWCDSAYLVPVSGASPGLHPYHAAGLYYLQDPSAMAPAILLDPQPGEWVLDLAASPGGKTTQLAALMRGRGLLVANEIKDKRLGHLAMNMERWGAGNVVITNETPERLADTLGDCFDRVLVDAPCSGEGMFRKDMGARRDWSPEMVSGCALRQGHILRLAVKLVKPGGFLLYSTCTFAPEEDEAVLLKLLDETPDLEVVQLALFPGFEHGRPEWIKTESKNETKQQSLHGAVRLFPHKLAGDGHFACLLRKQGQLQKSQPGRERLNQMNRNETELWGRFASDGLDIELPFERLRLRGNRLYLLPEAIPDLGNLRLAHPGVWLGTFKEKRFEPAHPLALYLQRGQASARVELESGSRTLKAYLRGETFTAQVTNGWVLVCVDGWPLGWGKAVQGLVKNHYPRGWMVM
jgi:NOL1/NOP2/sun family putative RNA methylase